MTGEPEREVMGLILTTNAELVSGVLRRPGDTEGGSVLAALAATRSLDLIVDDILHALAGQARREGHTWAAIGDVLHVTRQAAFQRFGGPGVETPREDSSAVPLAGAGAKATAILEHWVAERWDEVRRDFDTRMAEACSCDMLASARGLIERGGGAFLEFGTPAVRRRGGYTAVDVPMAFARQDMTGRVTFDADEQVAGFFVLGGHSS